MFFHVLCPAIHIEIADLTGLDSWQVLSKAVVILLMFQVTTYGHKDENNHWLFKKVQDKQETRDTVEYLHHGDLVRLEHIPYVSLALTFKRLPSCNVLT